MIEQDSVVEHIGTAEIELMMLLHPPTLGFTAFAVGDGDGSVFPTLAVQSNKLVEQLPVQFNRDSYISINQSCSVKRAKAGAITGHPDHSSGTISHLNAAYVDLDFYGKGLTESAVLAELQSLQSTGQLPAPSVLIFSGRGLWPLWLLRDENAILQPVPVTSESLKQHSQIQATLHKRLALLGSDAAALSPMRYVRMPGSLNTKSETVVRWEIQTDGNCAMPRYSLRQLAECLGLSEHPLPVSGGGKYEAPVRDYLDEGNAGPKKGQPGYRALRDHRYRDFQKLNALRGGFRPGHRHHAIFYFSLLLTQSGTNIDKAKKLASDLNSGFRPPLKPKEVDATVVSVYENRWKRYRLKDQTIADRFDITPDEASQLKCKTVATSYQLPNSEPAIPKVTRKESDLARMEARHKAIRHIVQSGNVPTCREMAELLKEHGIQVNHVTVSGDYKALGLSSRE